MFGGFFTFLTGRKQRIAIGSDKSDWGDVHSGVPQGTCLGPLLFLLFISDCPLATGSLDGHSIFVDDMVIWADSSRESQVADLEHRLCLILDWANTNGVDFNISKTKHVIFGAYIQPAEVKMGTQVLTWEEEYKYLGVLFHTSLKFDRHVEQVIMPKVNREIGFTKHLLSSYRGSARCTFKRLLQKGNLPY